MKKEEIDQLTQECLATPQFQALVAQRALQIKDAMGIDGLFRRPLHLNILHEQAKGVVRGDIENILINMSPAEEQGLLALETRTEKVLSELKETPFNAAATATALTTAAATTEQVLPPEYQALSETDQSLVDAHILGEVTAQKKVTTLMGGHPYGLDEIAGLRAARASNIAKLRTSADRTLGDAKGIIADVADPRGELNSLGVDVSDYIAALANLPKTKTEARRIRAGGELKAGDRPIDSTDPRG